MDAGLLIQVVVNLVGGLGVFLLGMKNMSEGLQTVAGGGLRKLISCVTDNRILAVLVGLAVTCTVQSSSITTVMVVGLVNSGFMVLKQALGVILGANIGTTITGWILTLKIGKYGLPMMGMSAFFFLFSRNERVRYIGMSVMGIGMIFFGLELMKNGLKPIRSEPAFLEWFQAFDASTYFGVLKCALVGCILTMIVQSSSATLGITMGLAGTGVIPFHTAAALVLGENIGTTITALLASLGANTTAKRAAYGHMVFNVLGVLWITALFPLYIKLITQVIGHDPNTVAMVDGAATYPYILPAIALTHTGFNVTNTLLFLPFLTLLARVTIWMAPDKGVKETPHLTFIDVRMLDTPSLGIAQSKKEIIFMGQSALKMLDRLRPIIEKGEIDPENRRKLFHREEILDNVQKEITEFLGGMLTGQISHDVMQAARLQLRMADEFESISDYIANILKLHIKLAKNNERLSEPGRAALLDLHDRVRQYLEMIIRAAEEDQPEVISKAYSDGEEVNRLVKTVRRAHLERLAQEQVTPLKSLVFTDMLNAYRRIKDHGVNAAEALGGEK